MLGRGGENEAPEVVRLRLLQEQPVQGCEITPDVYLSTGAHNSTDSALFVWKRCVFHLSCSLCSKSPVRLQCIASGRHYCSTECFKLGWPHRFSPREDRNAGLLQQAVENGADAGGAGGAAAGGYGGGGSGGGGGGGAEEHLAHKWMDVAHSLTYIPSADDVGRTLRLVCTPLSADGKWRGSSKAIDTAIVIAQPPPPPARRRLLVRNDEVCGFDASGSMRSSPAASDGAAAGGGGGAGGGAGGAGTTLSVVTYNVLADLYALMDTYPYCPSWALAWTYRRRNLLRDMRLLGADVYCLQEVQADHFEQWFEPQLDQLGYSGTYKRKTREFMGQYGKMDGCATFWRRDKLAPVDGGLHAVEFNAIAVSKHAPPGQERKRLLNRLLKDNVAQVGIFALVGASAQPGTPPQHVCVANTHINANTEFSDVKLWQTQYLLVEVERIVHEWIASSAGAALGALGASAAQLPVILAGDFNSTPGSTPYALLSTGFVERDAVSEDDPVGIIASLPLEHHMMLRSAHTTLGAHGNATANRLDANLMPTAQMELPYSNFTGHFVGTLDYIWYTSDLLEVVSILEAPNKEDITRSVALPSAQFPSDHIPLGVEFRLRPRQRAVARPPKADGQPLDPNTSPPRRAPRCGESERFVWDGTIDDEAHLGLADDDDDDDEPFVGVAAAESHTPALAPPGWDDNECSLEELFEDLEEGDWGARAPPVGGFAAPRNADAASFAPRAGLIADWEVDEEAHLHDAD
ncbi:hypothetical protein KFE25_012830 [Diacronema lutheri]|uniref:Endonuclease/exonuclease/phosphatase domain-containing protein n=1 Tax=Diacronema lutheri TaxID=2081491 RepID=A0A8J5XAB3_DIALT|nr:hypothetical protein KFE25_012830 [Diacronema lutheri]